MDASNRRRAAYKAGADATQSRRTREETQINIRKNKRMENLRKRRQMPDMNGEAAGTSGMDGVDDIPMGAPNNSNIPTKVTIKDIPLLTSVLREPSATVEQTMMAVVGLRRLLSIEKNPPVDKIIDYPHVLPTLVSYLQRVDSPKLMFEAAWALTNIASTHQTKAVVAANAIPPLLRCLHHEVADVREQAAWCLGNIAGDSCEFRDILLGSGAMPSLLLNIQRPDNPSLLGNVTWAVSNLCRGKPSPDLELVKEAIPAMIDIIDKRQIVPMEILIDAAWAISYVSDGSNARIEEVMAHGTAKTLVSLLSEKSSGVVTPVVRCLGNFVTGNDAQTQRVIDAGVMTHVYDLLEDHRKSIRKETCWMLSNIAAGTQKQIYALFRGRGRILRKVTDLAIEGSWDVRKEALYVICNIFTTGNEEQVDTLVQMDALAAIARFLHAGSDLKMILVSLEALTRVLQISEDNGKNYISILEEYDGIDALEKLQEHTSLEVYQASVDLLEKFFDGEEVVDENLAPMTDGNTFTFGMPSKQLFGSSESQPAPQFGNNNMPFNFGAPNFGGSSSSNSQFM